MYTPFMRTKSPFPGMDPWLESFWGDVHHTLISTLRQQIFKQLPSGLYAAIEENVYVVDVAAERQLYRPDVAVFDSNDQVRIGRFTPHDSPVAIAEPVRLTFMSEPTVEGHIEIRELRAGNPLVTVVEVLSPTNKANPRGRAMYVSKRDAYVRANVNILEIDLLRTGEHLISVPAEYLDDPASAPYKCAIRRADVANHARVDYFPITIRRPLPRIRLPLRSTDSEIVLDLQQPIVTAYEEGGFGFRIDYTRLPEPPLSPADAAWAADLLVVNDVSE